MDVVIYCLWVFTAIGSSGASSTARESTHTDNSGSAILAVHSIAELGGESLAANEKVSIGSLIEFTSHLPTKAARAQAVEEGIAKLWEQEQARLQKEEKEANHRIANEHKTESELEHDAFENLKNALKERNKFRKQKFSWDTYSWQESRDKTPSELDRNLGKLVGLLEKRIKLRQVGGVLKSSSPELSMNNSTWAAKNRTLLRTKSNRRGRSRRLAKRSRVSKGVDDAALLQLVSTSKSRVWLKADLTGMPCAADVAIVQSLYMQAAFLHKMHDFVVQSLLTVMLMAKSPYTSFVHAFVDLLNEFMDKADEAAKVQVEDAIKTCG